MATVTVSDKVDPAAVTVIAAVPSKSTPLIALAVAKAVAVSAFPVTSPVSGPAKASEVTVPSKKASLNSNPLVPRSSPASVTGYRAVALKVNSVALLILKSISSYNKVSGKY